MASEIHLLWCVLLISVCDICAYEDVVGCLHASVMMGFQ